MVLQQKQRQLQSAAEVAALQSLSMESRQQEGGVMGQGPRLAKTAYALPHLKFPV